MGREEDKIARYENYKKNISYVMVGAVIACVVVEIITFCLEIKGISSRYPKARLDYAFSFWLKGILIIFAVAWGAFVANLLLCAVCDHVIEMCYLNIKKVDNTNQVRMSVDKPRNSETLSGENSIRKAKEKAENSVEYIDMDEKG